MLSNGRVYQFWQYLNVIHAESGFPRMAGDQQGVHFVSIPQKNDIVNSKSIPATGIERRKRILYLVGLVVLAGVIAGGASWKEVWRGTDNADGIAGTAMPSWGTFSSEERWGLAFFIGPDACLPEHSELRFSTPRLRGNCSRSTIACCESLEFFIWRSGLYLDVRHKRSGTLAPTACSAV